MSAGTGATEAGMTEEAARTETAWSLGHAFAGDTLGTDESDAHGPILARQMVDWVIDRLAAESGYVLAPRADLEAAGRCARALAAIVEAENAGGSVYAILRDLDPADIETALRLGGGEG